MLKLDPTLLLTLAAHLPGGVGGAAAAAGTLGYLVPGTVPVPDVGNPIVGVILSLLIGLVPVVIGRFFAAGAAGDRARAAQLRTRAAKLRAAENAAGADELEKQADELDAKAAEKEAARKG